MRTPFLLLAALLALPQLSQATTPVPGVYDANGVLVGPLAGVDQWGSRVYMTQGSRTFFVYVTAQSVRSGTSYYDPPGNDTPVYFKATNCTGYGYVSPSSISSAPTDSLVLPAVVSAPGETLYVIADLTPVASFHYGSYSLTTGCTVSSGTVTGVLKTSNLGDLSAKFAPPFSVH